MCTNLITIKKGDETIKVKCRKCLQCRTERASQWAIKLIKENLYHKKGMMVTVTFDNSKIWEGKYGSNANWAKDLELSKEYTKKFFKKLRKKYPENKISYFKIGEYGEKYKRAHYHIIIWGLGLEDVKAIREKTGSKSNMPIYYSKELEDIWGLGRTRITELNNNSIKYVANYSVKKIKNVGKNIFSFSNREKIGTKWLRRNHKEIRNGYVSDDGKKYKIPENWIKELKNLENQTADKKEYESNFYITAIRIEENKLKFLEEKLKENIDLEKQNWIKEMKIKRKLKENIRDF